jgi:NAD(P)H dehydrogenase (quinone)
MTIAITGVTGQLGRLVVNQLQSKAPTATLIGLARTPAKAADLGIQVREADYTKPETLERALAGVETLLLISSSEVGQRIVQHRNVIEAAKKAGVQRIVYTSLLHADTSAIKSLAVEHLATEADLKASGLAYTILRNSWYTENYTASVAGALAHGAFLGCAGAGKISSATRADYAAAAAVVLSSEGHKNKTYELAGDQAYTLSDLAAEISRQSGKAIPYKNLSEAEYIAALVAAGLPAPAAQAYASFDTGAAQGALFDDGHQLSQLIGRATTPLATAVAAALKA